MASSLQQQFAGQQFANGYELVDGTAMHAEYGSQFQVPPDVLRKHIQVGYFVEVRVDSPRFSIHEEDAEQCACPSCNGAMSKPILGHQQPASLFPLPPQDVPSRGWGEDFWVKVTEVDGVWCRASVDNPLVEARLHELHQGDEIFLHHDHILTIHSSHRADMVSRMTATDLQELASWLDSSNP